MSHIQRPRFSADLIPFAVAGPLPGYAAAPARAPLPALGEAAIAGLPACAKRAADVGLALLLLLVLAPSMLAVALWIRLDSPGPLLFRQRRVGLHGRGFRLLKFRTMYVEPAAAPAPGEGLCVQATRNDPRVTRAGVWLRRLSVDEWPQLVNVLRGEMSLVGPRPHAPGTCAGGRPFEQVAARYAARHRVRPGITGLAQVRGWRGATETEEKLHRRLDSDLEYIEHWSLGLDLTILLRTVPAVLRATNAY
jgi:polysaccharide biosynthesis protein PslA